MYTQEHIDAVHRIRGLLDQGVSIGQVAQSPDAQVQRPERLSGDQWTLLRERMLDSVSRFDEAGLEDAYDEALAAHPLERVTRMLLTPLLAGLGDRWASSEGSIAEEHFFSMYLRNKIGARFHHRTVLRSGPLVLGACAPGEHHEIGLMLFALQAHAEGIRSVLLGANMPLEELPIARRRAGCDAIVISSSLLESPQDFVGEQLAACVRKAGKPVFVGGETSVRHRDAIVAAGAMPLGGNVEMGVQRLREHLASHGKAT